MDPWESAGITPYELGKSAWARWGPKRPITEMMADCDVKGVEAGLEFREGYLESLGITVSYRYVKGVERYCYIWEGRLRSFVDAL